MSRNIKHIKELTVGYMTAEVLPTDEGGKKLKITMDVKKLQHDYPDGLPEEVSTFFPMIRVPGQYSIE